MFKRTKGYFLLTMLVITGLAGRMQLNILTTKERHTLVTELKTSRNDFLKNVDGLSLKQYNFKTGKKDLSIKDCIYKLVSIENSLWTSAQASLQQETSTTLQKTFSDESLSSLTLKQNSFQNDIKFRNVKDALKFYKNERAEMLKYVHTSTENVRGHIAQTHIGNLDAYQLMLLNTIYCSYYTNMIEQIKTHRNFPK